MCAQKKEIFLFLDLDLVAFVDLLVIFQARYAH
jgi:hypothetical protein